MKKHERTEEVNAHKPLPGQKTFQIDLESTETDAAKTQQVTIRVSREAVRVLTEASDRLGLKRNRLYDEAIQVYAAMVSAGKRVQ